MHILAIKPGHDGHIAHIADGRLAFSIEAEKDSGRRFGPATPALLMRALERMDGVPDVFAVSGWSEAFRPFGAPIGAGYFGDTIVDRPYRLLGRDVRFFSSSHERSHLVGGYAMSPFPQGQPVYALVWEGILGTFYRIDEALRIEKLGTPLAAPGHMYAFIYGLADPTLPPGAGHRREDAGKLMALAGFGEPGPATAEERALIDRVLAANYVDHEPRKADYANSSFYNVGLGSQAFRNLARRMHDAMFERFHDFARRNLRDGLPLIITGGCGLNCDWNSAWTATGLFADVFVPPCANDSGSAIGTAADALFHHTGRAKIDWTVYAGEEFIVDDADLAGFDVRPRDDAEIASLLAEGAVFAWVQGRYEIGPRALGNRSIVAAPFTAETHARLNAIKQREGFRPIAPIVMAEEMDRFFEGPRLSPHMLYFHRVKTGALAAVTHVDGSARAQSVQRHENPEVYGLLEAFKARTGTGVLCNTSLNFKGRGFINRLSDLARYAGEHGLDGFVAGEQLYRLRAA